MEVVDLCLWRNSIPYLFYHFRIFNGAAACGRLTSATPDTCRLCAKIRSWYNNALSLAPLVLNPKGAPGLPSNLASTRNILQTPSTIPSPTSYPVSQSC